MVGSKFCINANCEGLALPRVTTMLSKTLSQPAIVLNLKLTVLHSVFSISFIAESTILMRILRYRMGQLFTRRRKLLSVFLDFNLPYLRISAAPISYVLARSLNLAFTLLHWGHVSRFILCGRRDSLLLGPFSAANIHNIQDLFIIITTQFQLTSSAS